jgi:hypothetical protein
MFNHRSILVLCLLVCLLLFACPLIVTPQVRKHAVDLNLTYGSHVKAETSFPWSIPLWPNENIGFSGHLSYDHFINEYLAATAGFGILYTREILTLTSTESSSIKHLMLGLKYYPRKISDDSAFRFFLVGSAGIAMGSDVIVKPLAGSSYTGNVLMCHLGAGCDFVLGSLVKLTTGVGYNFVDRFQKPLGTISNFSGPQISLGIGFMF